MRLILRSSHPQPQSSPTYFASQCNRSHSNHLLAITPVHKFRSHQQDLPVHQWTSPPASRTICSLTDACIFPQYLPRFEAPPRNHLVPTISHQLQRSRKLLDINVLSCHLASLLITTARMCIDHSRTRIPTCSLHCFSSLPTKYQSTLISSNNQRLFSFDYPNYSLSSKTTYCLLYSFLFIRLYHKYIYTINHCFQIIQYKNYIRYINYK